MRHKSTGTYWIALYVKSSNAANFDSFGVEYTPNYVRNKNITTNVNRVQVHDSIMGGYFYGDFIDFILNTKISADFTSLFLWNNFKKNYDIILEKFQ